MHLHRPPLSLGHILTVWICIFAFVLLSGLCWTALVLFLLWAGGSTFVLLTAAVVVVGLVAVCRYVAGREI